MSSSFIRLEVFASISLIIVSSIALSILTKNIFKTEFFGIKNYLLKISYVAIILFLFTLPLGYPENTNWLSYTSNPPTIFTGGTPFPPSNDWLETLEWIKLNTPEDAVIASWWDYGYWITTMSERNTIIDNATLETITIEKMANMFMGTPEDGLTILNEMGADYVLVFIAAQKINANTEDQLYILGGGGDESKIPWFARIAGLPVEKYVIPNTVIGTKYFTEQTMMSKLIPFSGEIYYHPGTGENSPVYKPGFVEIISKNIKYNSDDSPLKLVYASPSFMNEKGGSMQIILLYEINKNYSFIDNP